MSVNNPTVFDVALFRFFHNVVAAPAYYLYSRRLNFRDGARVLEFGCGSGALSIFLARRLARCGGHLTCLDVARLWVDATTERLKGFGNVDFLLGDIRDRDIAPDSFDAAIVHLVLHEIAESARVRTMAAVARVLRPGGLLYLREPTSSGHGVDPASVDGVMAEAGFARVQSREERSYLFMSSYRAVFRRL